MTSSAGRAAVTSLRLSHFRSYRMASLDPDGRSVALHGANGAGKTNILEAVSMLSPGRGLRRAQAVELVRRPESLGWKITADVTVNGQPHEIITAVEGGEATRRTVSIDAKTSPQTALGRLIRMVWLTPAMDRLWMEAAGDRRRFLDRMTLGFTPSHAETSVTYERAMRHRNRLLKEPGWDDAWIGGLEDQMARAGAAIARARAEALKRLIAAQNQPDSAPKSLFPRAEIAILGDMENRFHQALQDSEPDTADLDGIEDAEALSFAARLAAGRARDAAAGRTLEGPHRSDLEAVYAEKDMPARACSTGEQKALLISLCLANARALAGQTGTAPILLLDEIAAHLDEHRRRALYGEIEELGCQAWMTGTGPELFDGLSDAAQFAVSDTPDGSIVEAA